jgi:chemotaxis methyl-accepting protein methylase
MKYAYQFIREYLHTQAGIMLGAEKDYLIESRLHGLLKKYSLKDLEQLVCVLESTPDNARNILVQRPTAL